MSRGHCRSGDRSDQWRDAHLAALALAALKENAVEAGGTVFKRSLNTMFRVELTGFQRVVVHVSGKIRNEAVFGLHLGTMFGSNSRPYDWTRGRVAHHFKYERTSTFASHYHWRKADRKSASICSSSRSHAPSGGAPSI